VVGDTWSFNQVQVSSSFSLSSASGAGTGQPLRAHHARRFLIGIGVIFFDGKSSWAGSSPSAAVLTILAAVLMSLSIQWAPTSLFNTLLMFGLLAGGMGLIARSLRAYPDTEMTVARTRWSRMRDLTEVKACQRPFPKGCTA